MSDIEDTTKEGKMLIQNLSKMDFQDKNLYDNYFNLIIIFLFILAICDRESTAKPVPHAARFKHSPKTGFPALWCGFAIYIMRESLLEFQNSEKFINIHQELSNGKML